ncbi:MAG: S9 family peptidase, partial [Pseudomonadota bacterium]
MAERSVRAQGMLVSLMLVLLVLAGCSEDRSPDATAAQAAAQPGAPEAVALLPRALLFGNPSRFQGRISPDGRWLSWLAPVAGVLNVHVAPAADPAAVRVLTEDRGRGINRHFWSYDSESILYLQDQGGNENTHLYAVPAGGGAVQALTPVGDAVRVVVQALSPRLPGSVLIGMNDRDSSLFDLHRIDLGTGERTLVAENPGFNDWAVDLNLLPQAAMRARPGGGSEVLRREADGTWTPVATIPAEDTLTTGLLSMT